MKKVLLVLLALIMVLSTMTAAFAGVGNGTPPGQLKKEANEYFQFNDLSGYDWAEDPISMMAQRGVIKGEGGNKFVPNRPVKEVEVLIMLSRLIGLESELNEDAVSPEGFEGEGTPEWMIPYIALVADEGILSSEDLAILYPNSSASRETVAKFVYQALMLYGIDTDDDFESTFEDEDLINEEYEKFVGWVQSEGLMIGYKNKFQPKKPMTRAECAVLMNRIFSNFEFNFDFADNSKNEESTTGILDEIQEEDDSTTLEAIYLKDGTEFDDFDEDLVITITNKLDCCEDLEEVITIKDFIDDEGKYEGLEVDIVEEDGIVEEIILYYNEIEGVLDLGEEQDADSANIDPKGSETTTPYDFDNSIDIYMNCEDMDKDDFDDDDGDDGSEDMFEFHNAFEYKVVAVFDLDHTDKIIKLCISSVYEGELNGFDYDGPEKSITVDIGEDEDVTFILDDDCEINPDDDIEVDLGDIKTANEDIKFKVNGENEVIEITLPDLDD